VAAANAFNRAAKQLIALDKPRNELTESERVALRLTRSIELAFTWLLVPSTARRLRRALDIVQEKRTDQEKRCDAVFFLGSAAAKLQRVPEAADKAKILLVLWKALESLDPAFRHALSKAPKVFALLHKYAPDTRGRAGKLSAEAILARIIVEIPGGALGLRFREAGRNEEDPIDAIERIRRRLENDAREILSGHQTA
jgi:hypothetical protein